MLAVVYTHEIEFVLITLHTLENTLLRTWYKWMNKKQGEELETHVQ